MTRLSHAALRDLQFWKNLPKQLHHRPIWPKELAPTCTVHTDASVTAYGTTLSLGAHAAGCCILLVVYNVMRDAIW
jgi:hypothetical protein